MALQLPPALIMQTIIPAALVIGVIAFYLHRFAAGRRWLILMLGACLADQAVKTFIARYFQFRQFSNISLLGGWLQIDTAKNHTVGFGSDFPFLFIFALLFVLVLAWAAGRLGRLGYRMSGAAASGAALVAGGLMGIMIDRLRLGYVVDYLEFGPNAAYTYNLADLMVMLGLLLLCARLAVLGGGRLARRSRGARATRPAVAVSNQTMCALPSTVAGRSRLHHACIYAMALFVATFALSYMWELEKWEANLPPLHKAALQGDKETAAQLLEQGAEIEAAEKVPGGQITPLQAAVAGKQVEMVKFLLAHGAQADVALQSAFFSQDALIVSILLENGADPNQAVMVNNAPRPAFWTSIYKDDARLLRLILKAGADPNARDAQGWTALHLAASINRVDCARVLLAAEAQVNATDNSGATPLLVCAKRDDYYKHDMVPLLLEHKAEVNVLSAAGQTPLIRAVNKREPARVALLLAAGADPTIKGAEGRTALHYAAMKGEAEIIERLLRAGADRNAVDEAGKTALSLARSERIAEIFRHWSGPA